MSFFVPYLCTGQKNDKLSHHLPLPLVRFSPFLRGSKNILSPLLRHCGCTKRQRLRLRVSLSCSRWLVPRKWRVDTKLSTPQSRKHARHICDARALLLPTYGRRKPTGSVELVHVYIHLRVRNANAGRVEGDFAIADELLPHVPVIVGFAPNA